MRTGKRFILRRFRELPFGVTKSRCKSKQIPLKLRVMSPHHEELLLIEDDVKRGKKKEIREREIG